MNDHTSDHVHDERCSAYLDGELNPKEIEEFERLLESSEATRCALDDLRAVSACLSDLPATPASLDLRSRVLSAQPVQQPPPRSATGRRFRSTAMIATIVALMVLVVVAVLPRATDLLDNSADHGRDLAMVTGEQEIPAAAVADQEFLGGITPDEPTLRSAASTEDGRELVFNKQIDDARVGQIFSAIDTSDDQAVVIRLTVVDVEQGLNSLRLLLQKHKIPRADIKAKAGTAGADKRRRVAPGQLVSVVVKASKQQVSQAMANLHREVHAQMEIPGILHVAALETAPGGRQVLDQLQSYGGLPGKDKELSRDRKPRAAAATARKSPRNLAKPTAGIPRSSLASAQIRLDLPADMLHKIQKPAGIAKERQRNLGSPAGGEPLKDRRLQVIFVLVAPDPPPKDARPGSDGAA
jgi:hypothetical protein